MSGGGSEDPNVFNGEELFSFRRIRLAPTVVLIGFGITIYSILKIQSNASFRFMDVWKSHYSCHY